MLTVEYSVKKEHGKMDEITDDILDYWLGDATNKQARTNLRYECKYDPEVRESVLYHNQYVLGDNL